MRHSKPAGFDALEIIGTAISLQFRPTSRKRKITNYIRKQLQLNMSRNITYTRGLL